MKVTKINKQKNVFTDFVFKYTTLDDQQMKNTKVHYRFIS